MQPGESATTTDHEEIKRWADERGAEPAAVKDTGSGENPGVLRFEFEGADSPDALEPIDWDGFFDRFEENQLAFLYQDKTADGSTSRFFQFVKR